MTRLDAKVLPGSFRDPSGFVFERNGALYRQVNRRYREDYDLLMQSGLYDTLVREGLLIPHEESAEPAPADDIAYKVIVPRRIPFVSYPYEWCFSQLKDAALATLAIQKKAFEAGMSLKDASAYNIQFDRGRPVMIDTLSFEKYREGEPWVAYRQFCQHFLAPLVLMAFTDVRMGQLMRVYIDGVPLDLASRLLPMRTRLSPSLFTHIHLHARYQRRYAGSDKSAAQLKKRKIGRLGFAGLVDNLESTVRKLSWKPAGTEWEGYYDQTNYTPAAFADKERLVGEFVEAAGPKTVWDLGANTGHFSRIAAEHAALVVSFDIDPAALEKNYIECAGAGGVLPLLSDLTNPSPSLGWALAERDSLIERRGADAVLALALIHHLAISNNVPLDMIVDFFAELCETLIVEFVPKEDSQVQRLLATREDIFPDYTPEGFESALAGRFDIVRRAEISESRRLLYLARKSGSGG